MRVGLFLVTGGAGFIGSHLVAELVGRGERVRVLDDLSTGRRANLAEVEGDVEIITGSICDPDAVKKAMRGVDFVLHQAARTSVPKSVADPIATHHVNVNGTLNVLHGALEQRVQRVVLASSSSVYGETAERSKHEGLATRPTSPYGASKLAAESYALAWHRVYGLPIVALRYFNVFGPRQDPTSEYSAVIPKFITALAEGRSPTVFGDGTQSRDFTYVANVIDANLAACTRQEAVGQAINVAGGEGRTLLELLAALGELLDGNVAPVFLPARPGDIKHSQAAIERARELLGFRVRVSWRDGLAKTVDWYLAAGGKAQRLGAA